MIILDTNVLSELMRTKPDPSVIGWIRKHKATSLFITTLTQAEILYGLEILSLGKRRTSLIAAATSMFELDFSGRILPFDTNAAKIFATIGAKRRAIGLPISQIDAQIAAISLSHNAALATRNIKDFEECDLDLINPWETK
ncbi:MAG: type II toxin-antitoxin system VapC family toxin [Cyanobacteria bacterium P01_G01_bin.19]